MTSVPPAPADARPAGASSSPGSASAGSAETGSACAGSAADVDRRRPSLLQQAEALWRELPGLFNDRVELLELELKLAAQAATRMIGLLALAALLAMTAWVLLWAVVVSVLAELGVPLWAALAMALAVNLVGALLAARAVRPLVKTLGMPATRRHLSFAPTDAGDRQPRGERMAPARSGVSQDNQDHDHVHPGAVSAR